MSVLRLPAKCWSDLLERLGHKFPRTEAESQQLRQLLLPEHNLEDTLRTLHHTRAQGGNAAQPTTRTRWEGQRSYYQQVGEGAEDGHADPWFGEGDEYAILPECEEDMDDGQTSYTDSEQWQHENIHQNVSMLNSAKAQHDSQCVA